MIWKIFLYLFVGIYCLCQILARIICEKNGFILPKAIDVIFSCYVNLIFMLIISLFISLGWEKEFFSNNVYKIVSLILSANILFFTLKFILVIVKDLNYSFLLFPNLLPQSIILVGLLTIIYLAVISPIILAMIKYNKSSNTLKPTDKPYWKLFAIFYTVTHLPLFLFTLYFVRANLLSLYNMWDYLSILIGFYSFAFVIGYAFNKKIFVHKFWKYSAILVVIFAFVRNNYMTNAYKHDFLFQLVNQSLPLVINYNIISIIILVILVKYIFDKKIWPEKLKK